MEDCVNGTPFTVEKISPRAGLESRTARLVCQGYLGGVIYRPRAVSGSACIT